MNIYTKTGDSGETSLFGGSRVAKDDLRIWCYGTSDEACSILGVIYAAVAVPRIKEIVRVIQQRIFTMNAELAADESCRESLKDRICKNDIDYLEEIIDDYTRVYGKMTGFSIPGDTVCSSLLHVARTVIRRCERHITTLAREEYVSADVLKYINRLSDALFVLARMEEFEMFVKRVADKVASAVGLNGKEGWFEEICTKLCKAAIKESKKLKVPISFAVVDESGILAYFHREPGAISVSIGIAQNKAYSAVALGMSTGDLAEHAAPSGSLFGINTVDPKLVIFGGGFPLILDGKVVGGIGVSGASVEDDEKIARAAIAVFESEK